MPKHLPNQLSSAQLISVFQNGENFDTDLFLKVADMVSEKVSVFLKKYRGELFNLTLEEKDHLRIQVHGLKSGLAHVGAMELSLQAKHLENLLVKNSFAEFCVELKKTLPDLEYFFHEFEEARLEGFTDLLREISSPYVP